MKNSLNNSHKNIFILQERKNIFYILRKKFPNASNEDLEDVVQQALIRALNFYDISRNTSIKSYLTTIANNLYIDLCRKPNFNKNKTLDELSVNEISSNLDDFTETFCKLNYHNQLLKDIFQPFENDKCVQAFTMAFVEDLDYKDIAIIQNTNYNNVRKRIERARKLLQKRYHEIVSQE